MSKIHQKVCFCCGKLFYSRSILSKHCSRKCSNKYFRSKVTPSQAELKRKYEQQNNAETTAEQEVA